MRLLRASERRAPSAERRAPSVVATFGYEVATFLGRGPIAIGSAPIDPNDGMLSSLDEATRIARYDTFDVHGLQTGYLQSPDQQAREEKVYGELALVLEDIEHKIAVDPGVVEACDRRRHCMNEAGYDYTDRFAIPLELSAERDRLLVEFGPELVTGQALLEDLPGEVAASIVALQTKERTLAQSDLACRPGLDEGTHEARVRVERALIDAEPEHIDGRPGVGRPGGGRRGDSGFGVGRAGGGRRGESGFGVGGGRRCVGRGGVVGGWRRDCVRLGGVEPARGDPGRGQPGGAVGVGRAGRHRYTPIRFDLISSATGVDFEDCWHRRMQVRFGGGGEEVDPGREDSACWSGLWPRATIARSVGTGTSLHRSRPAPQIPAARSNVCSSRCHTWSSDWLHGD